MIVNGAKALLTNNTEKTETSIMISPCIHFLNTPVLFPKAQIKLTQILLQTAVDEEGYKTRADGTNTEYTVRQ